jgi:hypothetical protein
MATIVYRGTRQQLQSMLRSLPAIMAGRQPDFRGIARGLQLRVGVAFLSQVQQDYVTKARGGTGRDGVKWPPLKTSTIVARRRSAADVRSVRLKSRSDMSAGEVRETERAIAARRGELTQSMRGQVGQHPGKNLNWLAGSARGLSRAQVEEQARRDGATIRTIRSILGARAVEILIDTRRLFRAFSPGVEDRPANEPDQQITAGSGQVILGVNVPYFATHQNGDPKRNIPARPIVPRNGVIPAAYWPAILQAGATGIVRAILLLAGGAA